MKVVLDIDDFNFVYPRMDVLLTLREYFPNFKASLFTIPVATKCDYGAYLIRSETLKEIKGCLDWLQIIPHGFIHNGSEMKNMDYLTFKTTLSSIKEIFDKDGIPFVKGFKCPHWRCSNDVIKVLDEENWWGAVLREEKELFPKRFYRYNFLLNEPFWDSGLEVLKLHSHLYGTKNDLGLNMDKLLKLPVDTEFRYVTDYLEDRE